MLAGAAQGVTGEDVVFEGLLDEMQDLPSAWEWRSMAVEQVGDPEWHTLPKEQAAFMLMTHLRRGLIAEQVHEKKIVYGLNELSGEKSPTFIGLVLRHLIDFLMILLLVASGVSFGLGEYVDGAVILAIALLNVMVGALQEFRAEKTLEALRQLAASSAVVTRDGRQVGLET